MKPRTVRMWRIVGGSLIIAGAAGGAFSALIDRLNAGDSQGVFGYRQVAGVALGLGLLVAGSLLVGDPQAMIDRLGRAASALARGLSQVAADTWREARRASWRQWVVLVVALLLASEGFIRLVGHTDADGQFFIGDRTVAPKVLPLNRISQQVMELADSTASYIVFDPLLGWTVRPQARSENGLYQSNSVGLRGPTEYSLKPAPDVLRIAIFGDSFTHSDEVPYEESYGYQLERILTERGLKVEVLNFGVPGYGMDQAYLRWQMMGRSYQPDIVVFGLYMGDMRRNLSMVQAFSFSDNPITKPRFILSNSGELRVVNQPAVPPEQVIDLITHFESSSLAPYEYNYPYNPPEDYWWRYSKLLSTIITAVGSPDQHPDHLPADRFYIPDSDPGRLMLAIVGAFQQDVEAHGAEFIVVHMPIQPDVLEAEKTGTLVYLDLLNVLDRRANLVHTLNYFDTGHLQDYFASFNGHYSEIGNRLIAEKVAAAILDQADLPPD